MKNFCIIFLTFVIIMVTAVGLTATREEIAPSPDEYLRIHIRADSNAEEAQAVKYRVRDRVVEYLTPVVAECSTRREAMDKVGGCLPAISAVAFEELQKNGFFYGAQARLAVESFPTRSYGEYQLPAGEYTALVIELGEGKGDNWWCVVYPPLCFVDETQNVVYKSKIKEIIRRFYAKKE